MSNQDNKMLKPRKDCIHAAQNDEGFILVLTMLILVVLSLIGFSATNLTEIELKIAGNDRIHKETFYRADAGTEIGIRLAYDNAVCVQTDNGFAPTSGTEREFNNTIGKFVVTDLDFSTPESLSVPIVISDTNRAVAYYPNGTRDDTKPHTNLHFRGEIRHSPGSGLQMVSGYEGLGASSASGGTHVVYDIFSQHQGERNSETLITIGWKVSSHIINVASLQDCRAIYK